MPKLPMYERQKTVQRQKADGDDFGGAEARATGQIANTMGQIGERIQSRNETINRVRASSQFDQIAMQEVEAWQSAEDITDPQSIVELKDTLRTRMNETVSNYSGRAQSRAQLQAQLESQYNNYSKNALNTQIKAQHTIMANFIEDAGNNLAIDAMEAPDQIDALIQNGMEEVDKLMPVLNTTEEDAYRNNIGKKVVGSAIDSLIQKGQWQTAKGLMDSDQYGKYLTPSQSRNAAIGISKAQNQEIADQQRISRNVAVYSAALGRNLTETEIQQVKLMPDQDDMTLPDKIVQLELLSKEPVTQDQINKLAGTYIPKQGAGGTMTERFMNKANELSTRFAQGLTTPQEDQEFMSITNQLYGTKEVTDPITGLPRTVQVSMPLHIKQALQMRGLSAESEPAPVGSAGQMGQAGTVGDADEMPDRTIWDRAENVAGPVAAIGEKASQLPLIGQEFGINPQIISDRQFVETSQRSLIRALSESDRFSATEMRAIENEVNIGPSVWNNPVAYRQRLAGIDEAISKRIKNDAESLATGQISGRERKKAMDSLNAMTKFRETLGVPPRVKSVEEAMELPVGSQFIDPKGIIRVVPEKE